VIEEVVVQPVAAEVTTEQIAVPSVADSLLESKFRSLFTKWGGRGNY
jgi:hypothetical protein